MERFNDLFDPRSEQDMEDKEKLRNIQIEKFKEHFRSMEKILRDCCIMTSRWNSFMIELEKEDFINVGFDNFEIKMDKLKTSEDCVVVHFAIENVWSFDEFIPSIWDLID